MKKIKIARVVTVPFTLISLRNLFTKIVKDERFELHIISGKDDFLDILKFEFPNIKFHQVDIARKISIKKDLFALVAIIKLFILEKYDIVHSHTPKAGILNACAGFLTLRQVRLHTFTGQVWVNYRGIKKFFFVLLDKIISCLNTINYVDSGSQKDFLINQGVGSTTNLKVLAKGSIAGIDVDKFSYIRVKNESTELRNTLFPDFDGKVILYLGRINNDKGLRELALAFFELKKKFKIKLLMIGPEEELEPSLQKLINEIKNDKDVIVKGFVSDPEVYYGASDIYCLPSYREGCPTSILEASSMGKSVVASKIYGIIDIVQDEKTAYLFEKGNTQDLIEKLTFLLENPSKIQDMGIAGEKFVKENFSQDILTYEMINEYLKLMENK